MMNAEFRQGPTPEFEHANIGGIIGPLMATVNDDLLAGLNACAGICINGVWFEKMLPGKSKETDDYYLRCPVVDVPI